MKKRQIILIIICLALLGLTISTNYITTNLAQERVIKEQEQKDLEIGTYSESYSEEMPLMEEGAVAGANTEKEEETNKYNTSELSIIISSSIIFTLVIFYLIITKFGKYSLNSQINTTKKLIYTCTLLVLACSIIPTSFVIATDKKILNSYDTKSITEKSMAVIEVTKNENVSNLREISKEDNKSVIQVSNKAKYNATNLELTKESGKSTDFDSSTLYGLNSTFIAKEGSEIFLEDSKLSSSISYSSAFFATGLETTATLNNVELSTDKDNSSALNASSEAKIDISNSEIKTKGNNSDAIKTLDANSLININDSTIITEGQNSTLLYSKGKIEALNIKGTSNSYLAIIEDRNSLELTNANLITNGQDKTINEYLGAFLIYSQESASASNNYTSAKLDIIDSIIEINKDSSWYDKTPLFYLTNTEANINITNTTLNYGSDILLKAVANNEYGDIGDNAASVTLTATDQELTGEIIVDSNSKVRLNLNNSTYEGKINVDNLSANVDVTFDYDSRWELTGDSYINILQITKTDYLRKNVRKYIRSNGYNVYYNSANNEWLEGRTYNLQGGGKLIPLES